MKNEFSNPMNRQVAPALLEIDRIDYIQPKLIQDLGDTPVYFMEEKNTPAARIEIIFDCGSIHARKGLVSSIVGLLLSGTETKTMAEIHDLMDDHGSYFQAGLSTDHSYISIYGLEESIHKTAELIVECLRNATFPSSELALWLSERKQQLLVNLEKVGFLAQRSFNQQLFHSTPYANVLDIADYDALQREEIQSFFHTVFLPSIRKINLVGNFDSSKLGQITKYFKDWKIINNPSEKFQFNPQFGRFHHEKIGAMQTSLRIGQITFDRRHKDHHAMTILNTVLGDYFGSRLMQNIREDKGYTYGIGSFIGENHSNGYFGIATEVGNEFVGDTIEQIHYEIHKLRTELIPQDELDLVKNYLTGQYLKAADGSFAMMDLFSAVEMHDLDYSFYKSALDAIRTCTSESLLQVAKDHLRPEEWCIVSAG